MKLYAQLDQNDETVLNISTKSVEDIMTEVVLDDETLDVSKLPGYKINPVETVYHITFDQEKYDAYLETQKQQEAVEEGKDLLKELTKQITANTILKSATDEQAYVMRYLYEEWQPKKKYEKDDRIQYGGNLYKCIQAHTSEDGPNRTPDYLPALWTLISPEDPSLGTKENPIIVPEPFSSMEYIKGKYYSENNVVYLMNKPGMEDGETITLAYKPSQLVGVYFEVATNSDPNVEWPDFKQPTGTHDAYMKDDKVTYNGKHYISLIDNNTWSPDDYPQGWKLVEEE